MRRLYAMVMVIAASGCQRPLKPVFEPVSPPIQWPASPDMPRIRYIGSLAGEESLKKPKPFSFKALLAGPEPTIAFSTPTSVAVRGQRVYVADGQNHAIFALDLESREFRTIGTGGPHPLQWPADLAFVGDKLAVADSMQAAVLFFSPQGQYLRRLGDGILKRPVALAYREATDELWILDAAQHTLIVFNGQGNELRRFGQRGEEPGAFNYPTGLAYHERLGFVVADSMNFRIQILDTDGRAKFAFGHKGDAAGDFALPRGVAVDSEGHLYVLDNQFENIQVFDDAGKLLMAWGDEGRGPGQFYLPGGLFIDELDRIWVADTYNRRVQVFQYLREDREAHYE